jgi:signal transduction histidine kinase
MKGLTPLRLRLLLGLLLGGLIIPSSILIWQAYQQMQWETFFHYQQLAKEFAQRLDRQFQGWRAAEEARSAADYQFMLPQPGIEELAVAPPANQPLPYSQSAIQTDAPVVQPVQRSPLSMLPAPSSIPGLIGYFQVDQDGRFSTPVIPVQGGAGFWLPDSPEDRQRHAIREALLAVLAQNRLLEPAAPSEPVVETSSTGQDGAWLADAKQPQRQSTDEADSRAVAAKSEIQRAPVQANEERRKFAKEAPAPSINVTQEAFDDLSEQTERKQPQTATTLGQIADLQLDERFSKRDRDKGAAAESVRPQPERATPSAAGRPSGEQTALAAQDSPPTESEAVAETRIRMFDSSRDPFELAQLDSGHWVLFRKVWQANGRLIQGLIIEPAVFIDSAIAAPFGETALAGMSSLVVAQRDQVQKLVGARQERGYLSSARQLSGSLLYQHRLPAPWTDLQLIWSIARLPAGPGGQVVIWSGASLLALLLGGFWLLYRLGLRQIQLARQQQTFVSAVSHELKTPLTAIRMYSEMLCAGWTDESRRMDYYRYIHDESERLSRLIGNVLQLARLERNTLQLDLRPVSIGSLRQGLQDKLRDTVTRAGFECQLDYEPDQDDIQVNVDVDAFIQIMLNLIDNAMKFSARAHPKRIQIQIRHHTGQVCFQVRDFGSGVDPKHLKRIFKLFYRCGDELTRETPGTGIGLALVKQLVEAMGGCVGAENAGPGLVVKVCVQSI